MNPVRMDPKTFQSLILYEDNHLLILSKPQGIPVQNEEKEGNSLFDHARRYLKTSRNKPGKAWLGLVHRLDQSVSGVCIFAKNSKAAGRISRQFRDRLVRKVYLAVVEGCVRVSHHKLRNHLKKARHRAMIVTESTSGSRLAELEYHTLFRCPEFSILRIRLITGFYHQIRIQLSHAGHPVYGDRKYGSFSKLGRGQILLHCRSLSLEHPALKSNMLFSADLPETWKQWNKPPGFWRRILEKAGRKQMAGGKKKPIDGD